MRTVATAGHVDHGKTTLVRRLTGMEPDRLAEEKARGLTIDLGFAWTTLSSGVELAFVDVPGHARFIKNMLAGVGCVDACLFIVAATEGWKPQSEEHLRILELVGVARGVVALTKVGAVDAERRQAVRADVAARVRGTFLEGADLIAVDSITGEGLDAVRGSLGRLAATATPVDRGRPRLWVDRVFVVRGSGLVVTGTLVDGALAGGEHLTILPGDHPVMARELQSLERARAEVPPGSRLAVNLRGAARNDVARGAALVRPGQWRPTAMFDASLRVLAAVGHDVSARGSYAAYIGSGEHRVKLRLLGDSRVAPGDAGLVRVHLPVALPLLPGDRYVLREDGRGETVGGGEILDVEPIRRAAVARPTRDVDRVIDEHGWIEASHLEAVTGERRAPTAGSWVVAPDALAAAQSELYELVRAAGAFGLDVAGLDNRQRALVRTLDTVSVVRGRAMTTDAPVVSLGDHPFLLRLESAPFRPPPPDGVDRDALRELARQGHIVDCDGVWFAASAVREASGVVARLLAQSPAGLTVTELRVALDTTRKFVLPLLCYFDATGVTRRRGDRRVTGPRLALLTLAVESEGPESL